jgi:secreted PhoX family phosphatase
MRPRISVLLALIVTIVLLVPTAVLAQDPQPLVPLTDPLAPFLESRAYAASKGATAEFNKMEWVAFNPKTNKLYIVMSDVTKAMSDGEGSVKVEENRCGIIYEATPDEDLNITNLKPVLVGGPYNKDADGDRCDTGNISNPDSLFVDSFGNLWIGEDTSNHINNALWRWDGKELLRFATLPTGAEVTGVYVNNAGALFFSVQHPSAMSMYPFNRGTVVVINGFKANDPFKSVAVPTGDAMHTVTLAKGTYQVLLRVGESIPNDIYGHRFGQIDRLDGSLQLVCNHPDGNVFLPIDSAGTEGYLYTNFECRPGGVSKLYLRQDGNSWEILEGENVDFSGVMGTWNNCGSSITPWNTVVTSEEYEPFAFADSWKENVPTMTDFLGEQANPYDYGYLIELTPDPDGESPATIVEKRYAMGRFSHEMAFIMPDGKTVYHGDDGSNVILFKFVADEAGNLSAGTLFAAAVTQKADGSFDLKWIELGSGSDDEIAEAIQTMELPK